MKNSSKEALQKKYLGMTAWGYAKVRMGKGGRKRQTKRDGQGGGGTNKRSKTVKKEGGKKLHHRASWQGGTRKRKMNEIPAVQKGGGPLKTEAEQIKQGGSGRGRDAASFKKKIVKAAKKKNKVKKKYSPTYALH